MKQVQHTEQAVVRNAPAVDLGAIRAQFPILSHTMRDHPLAFLDNASTTQKPQRVIDAETAFYETMNANIHRGVYELSERATAAYEAARERLRAFINARGTEEIVFTRNATEAINLVAWTWGLANVQPGGRILLTAMEHHSNCVPWQMLARAHRASLDVVELTKDGRLDMDDLDRKLALSPALLALTHVSNVLGTVNPVADIVARAHAAGTHVLVDAAQGIARLPIDVQAWDADFVVFSGHKMYGPTGIGVLYGKREHLEQMGPFLTGGDMVKTVTREGATWNDLPWKFEAGTPNIAGGVALGEAVRFLEALGVEQVWAHEQALVEYTLPKLLEIPGLRILGPASPGMGHPPSPRLRRASGPRGMEASSPDHDPSPNTQAPSRAGVFSLTLDGIHSHDLASFLNERGIAIRGGHHCAQPLLQSLGLTECARASVGIYTTTEDIDRLITALEEARSTFA